ncbi:hypothetical protein DERP_004871 [Dermatophagoides pteronyssinus]|uniref:Uncharacterized protein n=1 Tax=Dermatophagoides pteronyssinus TaxID=6956 RepID=A0ABQ8JT79_DERPT|nr:hypothetical protein DERP_004871 [Dermatophagoides pteronyssinus]
MAICKAVLPSWSTKFASTSRLINVSTTSAMPQLQAMCSCNTFEKINHNERNQLVRLTGVCPSQSSLPWPSVPGLRIACISQPLCIRNMAARWLFSSNARCSNVWLNPPSVDWCQPFGSQSY